MGLQTVYADLHIHIGRTEEGKAVKISAANNLTFYNIAKEASQRKGIDMIGIIDCQSPSVQRDILQYLDKGEMEELPGGGIRFQQTTVILGSEIEVRDPGMGPAHLLAYMPTVESMRRFTEWLAKHMKNVGLSSQRIYVPGRELQREVKDRGGLFVPAHLFTPHKSIYGSSSTRMEHLLDLDQIDAVELGLSADSEMAGYISELDRYTYLTNSDAHSLAKIGREYNKLQLAEPSFEELRLALARREGRAVTANYGLNPRLGKYHRTYCSGCSETADDKETAAERCLQCGSKKIVRGVMDRIYDIADRPEGESYVPDYRPPYYYQVPLEYIPGLGPKRLDALLAEFGTEMNLLHRVSYEQLERAAGQDIADYIVQARENKLVLEVGGGGRYGKVAAKSHAGLHE
ncbi:TIGR00375 family protein [Paenibacillus sp. H1-7]|uniref:endonuclease Q family protein n=1 Tax=Paenibacillus sp. H1-7 TaxID=2282849 RepID=UPI001EF7E4CA|nr:endonuclease Q family protein [Paenibacillus sp. H1-7]ULL15484.1 TIGR00375 family protein [Paenibacillus sp. H1-7]